MSTRPLFCMFALLWLPSVIWGQQPLDPDVETAAWTHQTALRQLQIHPDHPYLQFVATQLSTNGTFTAWDKLAGPIFPRARWTG